MTDKAEPVVYMKAHEIVSVVMRGLRYALEATEEDEDRALIRDACHNAIVLLGDALPLMTKKPDERPILETISELVRPPS
jgi:hypothetical protein